MELKEAKKDLFILFGSLMKRVNETLIVCPLILIWMAFKISVHALVHERMRIVGCQWALLMNSLFVYEAFGPFTLVSLRTSIWLAFYWCRHVQLRHNLKSLLMKNRYVLSNNAYIYLFWGKRMTSIVSFGLFWKELRCLNWISKEYCVLMHSSLGVSA